VTDPDLLHVLDLATLRDWHGAKAALETMDGAAAARLFGLISELDHHEERRRKADSHIRHEIGNALSIVRANLEAIIDGILPATPERLKGMSDALSEASLLLDDLRRPRDEEEIASGPAQTIDLFHLVGSQSAMVASLATSKSVTLINRCSGLVRGDAERCARLVRTVVIGSIQFAAPNGVVEVDSLVSGEHLAFKIWGLRDGTVAPRALLRVKGVSGVAIAGGSLNFTLKLPIAHAGD
jgi:signal transduction histidine kinase